MAVMVINKENFQNEVLNSDKPVLLDFYADWCGPCRMVGPIVEEIAGERSDIKVGKINVDEQSELAAQFGVMSIPMLAVIKNGEVVNRSVGARPIVLLLVMLYGGDAWDFFPFSAATTSMPGWRNIKQQTALFCWMSEQRTSIVRDISRAV